MPRSPKLGEFAAIAQLQAIFDGHAARPSTAQPSASMRAERKRSGVEVSIGDDAAVLKPKGRLVWTVDTAVEHVHFVRTWLSLAELGWRSFQAAASDVCAMAGKPSYALSSVIFPAGFSARELRELARGQQAAARALGCRVVGGNLSRGAELSITTTLLGSAARPLLRSGAKPGDELWLCGEVGLAAAGLRLLQRGRVPKTRAARRALRAFRRPEAQLAFGLALTRRAHAAIDLSDGLCGDAAHLADASQVRLVIATPLLERALSPALCALAPVLGVPELELALYGGEDYALLATGPKRARPDGARCIGCVEAGRGVWLSASSEPALGAAGARRRAEKLVRAGPGFEHSGGRTRRRVGR
jgi:thiamine-monophosphate kinase